MGGGKSSGNQTTTVQMTPEQRELLQAQTNFLTGTAFPAYQNTIAGAQNALNQSSPDAISAAQNAMNVSSQAGQLQQNVGSGAYQAGAAGQGALSGAQAGLGLGLTGQGAGGVGQMAGYQQGLGQGLTGYGASQLSQLFSPDYKNQQIQAALQPATEDIREQFGASNAGMGAAGQLGSSRAALAQQNLASLGQARLGNIAAQTSANVETQRQNAANALMGAGQTASGQAGSLYGNLLGAGQNALGAAQQGFGALSSLGQVGLTGAQQSAAANIGYAQTPQDIFSKYASIVYGVPQGNTTPNFAGTQGSTTSGSSKGFGFGSK